MKAVLKTLILVGSAIISLPTFGDTIIASTSKIQIRLVENSMKERANYSCPTRTEALQVGEDGVNVQYALVTKDRNFASVQIKAINKDGTLQSVVIHSPVRVSLDGSKFQDVELPGDLILSDMEGLMVITNEGSQITAAKVDFTPLTSGGLALWGCSKR